MYQSNMQKETLTFANIDDVAEVFFLHIEPIIKREYKKPYEVLGKLLLKIIKSTFQLV